MMPEKLRKEKIQILEATIQKTTELAEGWRKERLAKGKDITNDMSLNCSEMLITLIKGWLASENELLEVERIFRNTVKTETKNAIRNTARRHG